MYICFSCVFKGDPFLDVDTMPEQVRARVRMRWTRRHKAHELDELEQQAHALDLRVALSTNKDNL